jgi:hypothetical protein
MKIENFQRLNLDVNDIRFYECVTLFEELGNTNDGVEQKNAIHM